MSIKVSIIIPIYNMEQWIGKAIETVEKQTLKEHEIICIDDGSTDQTLDLLYTYKQKYPNIQVLHQENKGSGPARNLGIMHAQGEYVAFLDADDYYYSEDALEYLYLKAKERNALICRGSSCDDRDGILSFQGLRSERTFSEDQIISSRNFPGPVGMWAGIYKREFLVNNQIWFPDLIRGQDGVFSTKAIAAAGEVYCLKKVVYVYRKEHKRVTYTERKAVDAVKTMYEIYKIASENNLSGIYNAWKKELAGEQSAILYKAAANGNEEMLKLAMDINKVIGGGLYEGEDIKSYMNQVQENKTTFLNELKREKEVYVFGAGTIGGKVVDYLKRNGITPTAVIVSDASQNPQFISEVPVRQINEIQTGKEYEIIIATFPYLQDAITKLLRENNYRNIIPLDLCAFYLWQDEIIH